MQLLFWWLIFWDECRSILVSYCNKTCLVTDKVGVGDQLWGQDIGICDDEERDLCSGFNMADVNLSFDNYEDIFASPQGPPAATFPGCPSMDRDGADAGDLERSLMQSIPEAELFRPLNVCFFHLNSQHPCIS